MKHFLKKLKSKDKHRISDLLDVFAQKLVKAYDDYQTELDEVAEKVSNNTGYSHAKATLEADGVIKVDEIDDGITEGIIVVDQRRNPKYREDVEFFRLLTEAETRSDLEYISWMYPARMQDPDVKEYVEIVDKVMR